MSHKIAKMRCNVTSERCRMSTKRMVTEQLDFDTKQPKLNPNEHEKAVNEVKNVTQHSKSRDAK